MQLSNDRIKHWFDGLNIDFTNHPTIGDFFLKFFPRVFFHFARCPSTSWSPTQLFNVNLGWWVISLPKLWHWCVSATGWKSTPFVNKWASAMPDWPVWTLNPTGGSCLSAPRWTRSSATLTGNEVSKVGVVKFLCIIAEGSPSQDTGPKAKIDTETNSRLITCRSWSLRLKFNFKRFNYMRYL